MKLRHSDTYSASGIGPLECRLCLDSILDTSVSIVLSERSTHLDGTIDFNQLNSEQCRHLAGEQKSGWIIDYHCVNYLGALYLLCVRVSNALALPSSNII